MTISESEKQVDWDGNKGFAECNKADSVRNRVWDYWVVANREKQAVDGKGGRSNREGEWSNRLWVEVAGRVKAIAALVLRTGMQTHTVSFAATDAC